MSGDNVSDARVCFVREQTKNERGCERRSLSSWRTNGRDGLAEIVLLEEEVVAAELLCAPEELGGARERLERVQASGRGAARAHLPCALLLLLGEPRGIDLACSAVLAAQKPVEDVGRLAQQHHLVEHGPELLRARLHVRVAAALDLRHLWWWGGGVSR